MKDVICFHAQDYDKVVDLLKLDVYEPPVAQVILKIFIFRFIFSIIGFIHNRVQFGVMMQNLTSSVERA